MRSGRVCRTTPMSGWHTSTTTAMACSEQTAITGERRSSPRSRVARSTASCRPRTRRPRTRCPRTRRPRTRTASLTARRSWATSARAAAARARSSWFPSSRNRRPTMRESFVTECSALSQHAGCSGAVLDSCRG